MELVIGGVYQGKLKYAKEKYGLSGNDIFTCREMEPIEFGAKCIDKTEEFVLWCIRNNEDPVAIFEKNREKWQDSVILCADIFCGVVPLEAKMRKWREETGRLCAFLSAQAECVTRLFCGIPQRLR